MAAERLTRPVLCSGKLCARSGTSCCFLFISKFRAASSRAGQTVIVFALESQGGLYSALVSSTVARCLSDSLASAAFGTVVVAIGSGVLPSR